MNRRVILCSVFLLLMSLELVTAQEDPDSSKSRWHVFSPPDKSFRIEVPNIMRYVKDSEFDSLVAYAAHCLPSDDKECRYLVGVIQFSDREKPETLGGLEFMIGGDNREPTRKIVITVDGLPGREIVYSSPPEFGVTYLRGRIIDAGTCIFLIRYTTDNLANLYSSSTNRFFNSFHVMRRRLKRTRKSINSRQEAPVS